MISPIDEVRKKIRTILSPNFSFIYLWVPIEVLADRDTKGLYELADRGEIRDLIGYSETNPYDTPNDADLVINASGKYSEAESADYLYEFMSHHVAALNKN